MNLTIALPALSFRTGYGVHRFELVMSSCTLWCRVPFVGQIHWARGVGWTTDRWSTIRDEGWQLDYR